MKITGFITMILFISFIFVGVSLMITDIQQNYPNSFEQYTKNNETFEDIKNKYSFQDGIKKELEFLRSKFELFSEPKNGWEKFKDFVGMAPLPFVILWIPIKVIYMVLANGYFIIYDSSNRLSIPLELAYLGSVSLLVILIFKLVSWYHSRDRI